MKYRVLLKFLQILVYLKRFFWWIGSRIYFVLGFIFGGVVTVILYLRLKVIFLLKRTGISETHEWMLKRDFLQIIFFLALFATVLSQTALVARKDLSYSGQKTLAYTLMGGDQEVGLQEIVEPTPVNTDGSYSWKTGAISVNDGVSSQPIFEEGQGRFAMGGTALYKPTLLPGNPTVKRNEISDYEVVPGDSLSSIAYEYGVSVPTILWENNLNSRSVIRPGDVLKIPPTTGIMHTVKKGDTLKKIATLYGADAADIIAFNHLSVDGHDLIAGDLIMVPNGEQPQTHAAPIVRPSQPIARNSTVIRRAAPPNSVSTPSVSGFIWPTTSHLVTQYFGLSHHAIDIGGPWQSPIYATKSGVVEVAQCGWNSGYGCYIIIDHGDGIKSLYGHNSQLLVSPGDEVSTGQTIALMGNTGHVSGVTGIHSHFEIQVNGARVNPLRYVH